ncbi:hypothetical protein M3Y96_00644300 [Aphelenchoides besseyi]|nr:hypothetical protein M3Y96_00644300 [Aphelenchoides besseyi]
MPVNAKPDATNKKEEHVQMPIVDPQLQRLSEIFDAADREQLECLQRDRNEYTAMVKQIRRLHIERALGSVLVVVGMLILCTAFVLYRVDNSRHFSRYLKCSDQWSQWETPVGLQYRQRKKCSTVDFAPLSCPTSCNFSSTEGLENIPVHRQAPKNTAYYNCTRRNQIFYVDTTAIVL